ncbi:hypothetical protein MMC29_004376 [Sticta canariensis]|nr:hypothetical protein [Sticta canariensis]
MMGLIMLFSSALGQDEDWGKFLWNVPGAVVNFEAGVLQKEAELAGAVGSAALGLGVNAFNSLTGQNEGQDSGAENNFAESNSAIGPLAAGSGSDTTFQPLVGGPVLDSTFQPFAVGSASDNVVQPAADGETSDLLNVPNVDTPTPLSDPTQESPTPSPGPSQDISSNPTNDNAINSGSSCDRAIGRIIWPTQCGDSTAIQDALTAANVNPKKIRISEDDCGTYFLTAPMTKVQIGQVLESAKALIKSIVADDHVISDGISSTLTPASRRKNRRDRQIAIKNGPEHLHAISVPWRKEYDYVYLENAGQSIDGYMLLLSDQRIQSLKPEFTTEHIIKSYIHALAPEEVYDYQPPGNALSLVSLVSGQKYGACKKASLTLVMMAPTTSSFLDGLKIVRRRLRNQNGRGLARTVVMTPVGFKNQPVFGVQDQTDPLADDPMAADRANEREALQVVKDLIDEFQVVFICAAGDVKVDLDGSQVTEPHQWPANWVSRDDGPAIISVGGYDHVGGQVATAQPGFGLAGSVGGDAVTVFAPYFVTADNGVQDPVRTGGTACSAALTMGLAMDFLSRPNVRAELGLSENEQQTTIRSTSLKMREYIVETAFPRSTAETAPRVIWNGLGLPGRSPHASDPPE